MIQLSEHPRSVPLLWAGGLALGITLWPFLSYLATNLKHGLAVGDVMLLAGTAFAVAVVVAGTLSWLFRSLPLARSLLTLASATALLFCFDAVREAMSGVSLGHIRYSGPVWALLWLIGVSATFVLSRSRNGCLVLSAVLFGLLVVPFVQLISVGVQSHSVRLNLASKERAAPVTVRKESEKLPDIYFFVLDAFGRADMLRAHLKFDNSTFIADLSSKRYKVLDKSRANYLYTV